MHIQPVSFLTKHVKWLPISFILLGFVAPVAPSAALKVVILALCTDPATLRELELLTRSRFLGFVVEVVGDDLAGLPEEVDFNR